MPISFVKKTNDYTQQKRLCEEIIDSADECKRLFGSGSVFEEIMKLSETIQSDKVSNRNGFKVDLYKETKTFYPFINLTKNVEMHSAAHKPILAAFSLLLQNGKWIMPFKDVVSIWHSIKQELADSIRSDLRRSGCQR